MSKNRLMSIAALSLIALTACSSEAPSSSSAPETPASTEAMSMADKTMETKVKAVLIYADWCGSCKVLDPKIKEVKSNNRLEDVNFVTLDYTNKNPEDFYAQAKAAGVEAPIRTLFGEKVKTGLLLLVDADDNLIIGQVTKAMTPAEILGSINAAVAAS